MNAGSTSSHRAEADHLGQVNLGASDLFGVQTARGMRNFDLSDRTLGNQRAFVRAFAQCKWAAAMANHQLGLLTQTQRDVIVQACQELAEGSLDAHMTVDLLEGSGGTSTNMNVNEVIANRAQQLLGRDLGTYDAIHPNDHVNRSQSTNDVYPSALKLAVHSMLPAVISELRQLADSLDGRACAFEDILHLGRTCLQDAQPMRLGQMFEGYASLVRRLASEIEGSGAKLLALPLGGTAIGTGFGSSPGYRQAVYSHLREITGLRVEPASDPFDAMQNLDAFGRVSSELKTAATSLGKMAMDMILLSSGPTGGIGELQLPAVQAGSSIMPGKVNPVMPMSICQIGFILVGNDAVVSQAIQAGQLEINHFEPVIADRIFESIRLMERGIRLFRELCVDGIVASREANERHLLDSSAIATALVPKLGYSAVSSMVRKAHADGITLISLLENNGVMSAEETRALVETVANTIP